MRAGEFYKDRVMRLMRILALFQARPHGLYHTRDRRPAGGQPENRSAGPPVARRVKETTWHEGQRVEDLADSSVRMRLLVAEPTELKDWVLGWGADCEVIAPASFRAEIAQEVAAASGRYRPQCSGVLARERRAG